MNTRPHFGSLASIAIGGELAEWLREVAGRCQLPSPQREFLTSLVVTSIAGTTCSGGRGG